MVSIYQIRRIVSIILFVSWIISFITGVILYLKTTKIIYKGLEILPSPGLLHTYSSFIMSGVAIIHMYLNWNCIKSYLGLK